MPIHQAAARQLLKDMRGVDTALERLSDATNVALSDSPNAPEYALLIDIAARVLVMQTAFADLLSRARSLWPES
jgi:hypothetical protein